MLIKRVAKQATLFVSAVLKKNGCMSSESFLLGSAWFMMPLLADV
jgi:hypothetical protein